ncbi:hypothetical protein [Xanthocytophaga agilis]|uniref:Uncharacterized protein n=1 Tax=Xanthocytophaga agilis TaxID=3048010 RepID=A0AAE3R5L3_9BACT|nr:hypothetical protein [Xanthocytophaga agilis]MDJ1503645.1 hypothetical protein [Xanthocytophaga agilis]
METERIVKSAGRIKEQIIFWYLSYCRLEQDVITGKEGCTLFYKVPDLEKETILSRIKLSTYELPVLLTRVREEEWILNTTEHFIQIKKSSLEKIPYEQFRFHAGPLWKEETTLRKTGILLGLQKPSVNPKIEGKILPFGIMSTDEKIKYWDIPTGNTMYTFWNVTKKCELIGRKYQIEEYRN